MRKNAIHALKGAETALVNARIALQSGDYDRARSELAIAASEADYAHDAIPGTKRKGGAALSPSTR